MLNLTENIKTSIHKILFFRLKLESEIINKYNIFT